VSNQTSITNADTKKLVRLIHYATQRIIYLAPGVSEELATALAQAWTRLGTQGVSVILDVDPEVCRLGYGTIEGLKVIRDAALQCGTMVCHQPGIRIGLLIADDTTLIYTPVPLLIEAGSTNPHRPNAIQLQDVPTQLARDVGIGEEPDRQRVVGLDPIKPSDIDKAAQDLAAAPPVKFDLARRVRVFTSRFQFVELEMTGCFISRKKAPIPSALIGLARQPEIESQFHAHFNMVTKTGLEVETRKGRLVTERRLLDQRRDIEKSFLIPLTGYGSVVLRANKDRMLKAVRKLRAAVKVYAKGVRSQLQEQMDDSAKALVKGLFPAVKQNPPDSYTKLHGLFAPEDYLRQRLTEDIDKAFGKAEDLVSEMQVKLVFKDVAYESLVDGKFLEIARKAMPGVKFLHEEFDAAQAVT